MPRRPCIVSQTASMSDRSCALLPRQPPAEADRYPVGPLQNSLHWSGSKNVDPVNSVARTGTPCLLLGREMNGLPNVITKAVCTPRKTCRRFLSGCSVYNMVFDISEGFIMAAYIVSISKVLLLVIVAPPKGLEVLSKCFRLQTSDRPQFCMGRPLEYDGLRSHGADIDKADSTWVRVAPPFHATSLLIARRSRFPDPDPEIRPQQLFNQSVLSDSLLDNYARSD